ncbi:LysR family transcriptional regulator [Cupriavidus sp. TA19]|uniref:LysR family transcriptional regulator n=1 Tax=Cupriavidus sp. TA19 TaxID=701108 RepID=UPI0027294452|nr:LysR family transcriptional regulator [Cupriavidus sp. TA19]GLC91792.1 LysR family transcriptional regulator [Cupriavidus sp. TA19]
MNLSIRQLKVFVAISQLGSFAEAAKVLHLSSPALSLIVKSVEETAGFKVFDRTTRSVRLTQAGQALLPYAERLLSEHRNLTQAILNIGQKSEGVVRVAATQLLSCTILPPVCTKLQAKWPKIKILPVDALFDKLQELLVRGEVDFVVAPERTCEHDIVAAPIFSTRLNIACSINHPFAGRTSVKWAELQDEQMIMIDRGAAPLIARDAKYQFMLANTYDVGHFTTALALANENRGVVVSPDYGRRLMKAYDVVLVPLVEPSVMRKVMLYRNRRFALSPAAERFAEHLSRLLSGHGEER